MTEAAGRAHARSLRHGNQRATAGHHVCPRTSPTMRAAAALEKARPPRVTMATTAITKRPGPLTK
jgi:hypothetical protein